MTPEQWQQIEKLYHVVSELPPEEREQYLSAADQTIRSEVDSLLRTGDSSAFLDRRAIEVAAQQYESVEAPELAGRELGRYRVLSRLGAGGMGVVYLAERKDIGSVVAIKLLRDAFLSPARIDRFVSEQKTLAKLEHPFIAPILDAGTLANGTPWFVMPYVEGTALT